MGRKSPVKALTLREAFDRYYRPDLCGASPATVRTYQTAVNRWERFTTNPPVSEITNGALLQFRNAVIGAGLKPATFNQTWRHLRCILRRLGPQQWRNPLGAGVLKQIPHVRSLPEDQEFPRLVTFAELDATYAACDSARWPCCVFPAADWWRAVLVVAYNTLGRFEDLFSLKTSDVSLSDRTLRFRASKTKKWHVLPLNDVVYWHLRRIWSQRELLFPPGAVHRSRHELHRLQELAGVEEFGFQNLRETGASQYEASSPGIAAYILGHALKGVTARYYLNVTEPIQNAVERLPQPAAFRRVLEDPASRVNVIHHGRRTEWGFDLRRVTYRGRRLPMSSTLARLLQALVNAHESLSFAAVRRTVFWDRPDVSDTTIKTTVNQLRRRLQHLFELPADYDPLPWHDGGWLLRVKP